MPKLAIDFGTSNTLVATWNEAAQAPRTLRLEPFGAAPQGEVPSLVPSLLYVQDAAGDHCLVGTQVRDQGQDLPGDRRFFAGFKRAIAADIPGFSPTLDGIEVTAALAGELYLARVLGALPKAGYDLDEVVFTVPVQSFERYLHWLRQVAGKLGIPQLRLIDEPTAAALGYQVYAANALVLVVDFGGGTLDVSLVRTPGAGQAGVTVRPNGTGELERDRLAQVVAKSGQVLGGEDVDHWLVDDFLRRHGLTAADVEEDVSAIKALAEQVKIRLSSEYQAELAYFSETTLKTYQTTYNRAELEDLLEAHDFYAKLQAALDQALRQAEGKGVRRDEIAHVLLVGGTTLIPSVQRAIRQNFSHDKVKSHAPFEAVAHGALQLLKGLHVEDFLYHGYGIRYWDARSQRHAYEPIFAPGTAYPTAEPVEIVLRASRAEQPAIELVIGEFEPAAGGASEVVFDGKRLVSTALPMAPGRVVALNDAEGAKTIAPLDPPGFPGVDRVRVLFNVDSRRQLRLHVTDLQSGRTILDDEAVIELR
ncbi:Chaperone protein DnaK [compost metagenome]